MLDNIYGIIMEEVGLSIMICNGLLIIGDLILVICGKKCVPQISSGT